MTYGLVVVGSDLRGASEQFCGGFQLAFGQPRPAIKIKGLEEVRVVTDCRFEFLLRLGELGL